MKGQAVVKQLPNKPVKEVHTQGAYHQVNKTSVPMVVTEEKRDQINHKIEKRKFASNDAALFAGHINHGMHQIQLSLVKISRNHIGETLAPIVRRFQRSMGYAYQTKNEKAKQPKTNIPENPVQQMDCLIDHRSEEYENECKQKYGFTLPGTNIE